MIIAVNILVPKVLRVGLWHILKDGSLSVAGAIGYAAP